MANIMKKLTTALLILSLTLCVAQTKEADIAYYLPGGIRYDPAIPKPADIIGHEVGEWHVTHDKLTEYMKKLAQVSDRITIENRGSTYEGRPLLLLTITSAANHRSIEEIRKSHLQLTETNTLPNVSNINVLF